MAALLVPAVVPSLPHLLRLPDPRGAAGLFEEVRYALGPGGTPPGPVLLDAGDWLLRLPELRDLRNLLLERGLLLRLVRSRQRETEVAASALGLILDPPLPESGGSPEDPVDTPVPSGQLTIHRGTLRSGDHLEADGSVLLLGDVNPGARISAGGHVLVWGRLRGIAHAGRHGDRGALILAMQLRPLQLRIADVVARGPEETPPPGLAEEARVEDGTIRIDPARPGWPLPGVSGREPPPGREGDWA